MKLLVSIITLTIHGGIPPHHTDEKLVISKDRTAIFETTNSRAIGKFSCAAPEKFTALLMSPKLPKKKTTFAHDSTIAMVHIGQLDRIWRYQQTPGFESVEEQYEQLKQSCLQKPVAALKLSCDAKAQCKLTNVGTEDVKTVDPKTAHGSIKCASEIQNPGADAVPPQRITIKPNDSIDVGTCKGPMTVDLTELQGNDAYRTSLLGVLSSEAL